MKGWAWTKCGTNRCRYCNNGRLTSYGYCDKCGRPNKQVYSKDDLKRHKLT